MKFDLFCPVHCPPHLLWACAPPTEGYHWTFIYLFILLLNESTEYLIICFPICLFNYNDNRYYPHDMWGLLYFDVLMILPVGERLALCAHYMFRTFTGNISKYEVTILRQIRHFALSLIIFLSMRSLYLGKLGTLVPQQTSRVWSGTWVVLFFV